MSQIPEDKGLPTAGVAEQEPTVADTTQRRKPTKPWQPASLMDVQRLPGMTPRFVRKDKLEKAKAEGWIPRIDKEGRSVVKRTQEAKERVAVSGSPLDTTVQLRELILCDMPDEMVESRREYYKSLTDSQLAADAQRAKQSGVSVKVQQARED